MGSEPAPPAVPSPKIAALRLALVPGVGPLTRKKLLERFGSPEAVLSAAPSDLRTVERVGPKVCRAIAMARADIDVDGEVELCRQNEIEILDETDAGYPKSLREIADPPGVLFVRGKLQPSDAMAIGIVGSRHATQYGLAQAERLAGALARAGLTVVSGLARGIDAVAHRGALAAGGRTIAVLASGVLNIYPPEHVELADEVTARGAVISESPPKFGPLAGMFPQRNRIISGLSLGSPIAGYKTKSSPFRSRTVGLFCFACSA